MMERVDAGLPAVEMWWRYPLSITVFEFPGGPAARRDEFVVGAAAQGEIVNVGFPALGVVGDMVDFGEVAGHAAVGKRASAVFGVQHNSLTW